MFRIETEKELLNAFRSRDRKHVELPKGTKLPLFVRDYLAWVDPYGVRIFLLFSPPGSTRPMGIAFRRDQQGDKALASRVCEWCHAHGTADQIGLLTTDVDAKRRVGVNLCLDLRCNEKLESMMNLAGADLLEGTQKLLGHMARFADEALGMEVRT
ncbi:FBP domain-containing protein [Pyxidicoccus xibeiensis]|uniref:FBP domain-containing protein n=1 Tax=Pyxidicoccus xibeiensis TaxID=2906759 RepID=UPI0020A7E5F4|nr:FBP domain-containing protein [Pyxidicoccus xibeiensis]MCP3140897.1 FBP domain-containing protein [Pyxidicoccus xibeiensis]